MRNRFQRINCIFHFIGNLLRILGLIILLPLIVVFVYWGQRGDGWNTVIAFVIPALASFSLGLILRSVFKLTKTSSNNYSSNFPPKFSPRVIFAPLFQSLLMKRVFLIYLKVSFNVNLTCVQHKNTFVRISL